MRNKFLNELQALLEKYGLEKVTGTPGHILALYIDGCMCAYATAKTETDEIAKNNEKVLVLPD